MKKLYAFILIVSSFISTQVFATNTLNSQLIQKIKQGVVSISNNTKKAAYSRIYPRKASAFLIDKKQGIFVTNAHVANDSLINNITLTTFNGREIEAKFLYNDPHKDFAFLKAETNSIPDDVVELKLKDQNLKTYQPLFIISNNEGKDFSIQTGNMVSQYNSIGNFPAQTITISLNTRGGSSGSPVLDYDGNVVALNFGGHETYADALKIAYIIEALPFIKENKTPPRQTTGAFATYHSLDKAVKYQKFPKNLVKDYIKKYPNALNKALAIRQIQYNNNSPLQTGDIIWQINGEDIGPNMYKMDNLINNSTSPITITIYRNGEKQNISLTPHNINKHKIDRMVIFGDTVFYEVNETINLITGAPLGSLFVTNVEEGASFDTLPFIYGLSSGFTALQGLRMVSINGFNNQKITSIDELIKIIPALVKQKYFTLNYTNYFFGFGSGNVQLLNRNPSITSVEYESYASEPVELNFNSKTLNWDTKKIL